MVRSLLASHMQFNSYYQRTYFILNSEWHPSHLSTLSSRTPKAKTLLHPRDWQQPGRSILDNYLLYVPDAREVRGISEGVLYWLTFSLNIKFIEWILMYVCGKVTTTPTFPNLSRQSCAKSSSGTIFVDIFRCGAHCTPFGSDILGQRI